MEPKEEELCRICLKTGELEVLEESMEEIFGALLLNINFSVTEQPMICKHCDDALLKSFEFKAGYMSVEDCLASFLTDENERVVDLMEIYADGDYADSALYEVCRFCTQPVGKDLCLSLDALTTNITLKRGSLSVYVPEMDLTVTEDPVICPSCREALQDYVNFKTMCWDTEDNIKRYCEVSVVTCKVRLSDVVTFVSETVSDCKDRLKSEEVIKEDLLEYEDCVLEVVSKNETNVMEKVDDQKETTEMNLDSSNSESLMDANSSSTDGRADLALDPAVFKCGMRENQADNHFRACRHLLKLIAYRCQICSFVSKEKSELLGHFKTHQKYKEEPLVFMYKCEICPYEITAKPGLDAHMPTHTIPKSVIIYKCNACAYKTVKKFHFQRHLYVHVPASERPTLKCKTCGFQTKSRGVLERHRQTHKKRSELK